MSVIPEDHSEFTIPNIERQRKTLNYATHVLEENHMFDAKIETFMLKKNIH